MKRILFVLLLFVPAALQAQVGWEWAKSVDKPTAGGSEEVGCTTDAYGNLYVTGYCFNSFYIGHDTFTNFGGNSAAYIVKYDSLGNVLWANTTNHGNAYSLGLTTDYYGGVYLLGGYDSTFRLGSLSLTNSYSIPNTYFIAKFKSSGTVEWVKNIGSATYDFNVQTSSIASDNAGNIYIFCPFSNNPILGGYSLTNSDITQSSSDMLVAKFDSAGNVTWARSFGGKKVDLPIGISVTSSYHIYLAGSFHSDTLTFGSAVLRDTSSVAFYWDMFLAKVDTAGNPIWAKASIGPGDCYAFGLATDSAEDAFVTASYDRASVTLGSYNLPAPPAYTSYGLLAKFNTDGNVSWVKEMQGQYILPFSAATDPCSNIWIIGSMGSEHLVTNDTIDGQILVPPTINGDPNFIACWNNSGGLITANALPSGSSDDPNGITADKCGNIYVAAEQENCDTLIIANDTFFNSGEDIFVAKYNPNLGCGHCKVDLINDPIPLMGIDLYPNPANNTLTITSTNPITTISITNLLGQIIYTHTCNADKVQVDVSSLPIGIYFAKINGTVVRKFVKQ